MIVGVGDKFEVHGGSFSHIAKHNMSVIDPKKRGNRCVGAALIMHTETKLLTDTDSLTSSSLPFNRDQCNADNMELYIGNLLAGNNALLSSRPADFGWDGMPT